MAVALLHLGGLAIEDRAKDRIEQNAWVKAIEICGEGPATEYFERIGVPQRWRYCTLLFSRGPGRAVDVVDLQRGLITQQRPTETV